MGLVFAAIAPHGFPIIPDLSDDAEGGLATRAAMFELGRRCAVSEAEVIVIAGPHGFRVDGAICLADVARGAGTLHWKDRQVEMNLPVDGLLTDRIATEGRRRGIPIAMGGYAGNRRYQSVIPIDWGVMTPLWFLGHERNLAGKGNVLADPPDDEGRPPAVIVTPSRSLPRETLIDFGRAIASAAEADGRRVAFIASCDWGHRHKADGPYGFHEASGRVDDAVVSAVASGNLRALLDISDADAAEAAIDGLWQTLMLIGALEETPLAGGLIFYEAPSYYGMLVAAYGR